MSSLTALVTVALHSSCDVKHSPFRGQLSLFRQLHPNHAVLGFMNNEDVGLYGDDGPGIFKNISRPGMEGKKKA